MVAESQFDESIRHFGGWGSRGYRKLKGRNVFKFMKISNMTSIFLWSCLGLRCKLGILVGGEAGSIEIIKGKIKSISCSNQMIFELILGNEGKIEGILCSNPMIFKLRGSQRAGNQARRKSRRSGASERRCRHLRKVQIMRAGLAR